MYRFYLIRLCFVLAVASFLLSACKKDEEEPEEKNIKIGALLSMTGAGSSTGESTQVALNLAVTDINEYFLERNSDKTVSIIVEDSQTDTAVALQKVTSFYDQGIQTVIGPYSSASVAAVKDYVDQNDMVVISPSSVASSLAIPQDHVFRLVPADFNQGEAMAALLDDDTTRILVPIVRDDLWGSELLEATTNFFSESSGGMMANAVKYPVNTNDFSQYITELENRVQETFANYETDEVGVYMICFGEGTDIVNAAFGFSALSQVRWYGSSAYSENESLTSDPGAAAFAFAHGLVCPIMGLDPASKSKWEPLQTRIENEIGRKPEIYALCAYDALWLAALTYFGTGYPIEVDQFIYSFERQANDYFGATGWTTLNSSGDREFATYDFWGIIQNGSDFEWEVRARYDNNTKVLTRYQ